MIYAAAYLLTILAVNIAFGHWPELSWLWAIAVGSIFVTRDYAQRALGHWVVVPMVLALALSYILASPFVALASAAAFAISESMDWIIFTITRRPLPDRVLWSCATSAPLDSLVFLGMIGALSIAPFALSVASKMVAALMVWSAYWVKARAAA